MANYVNYKEKMKQLDNQKLNLQAKMERDERKAYDDACFTLGRMLVDCFPDVEVINWEAMQKMANGLRNSLNKPDTAKRYLVPMYEGMPGYNLKRWRDKVR